MPFAGQSLSIEMTTIGFQGNKENIKRSVAMFVRNKLFRKCKFPSMKMFHRDEKIARKVMKELDITSRELFLNEWDDWIMKHIRVTLQEKRSTCGQAITKEVIGK